MKRERGSIFSGGPRLGKWVWVALACCVPLSAQSLTECQTLQHHGKLTEARACYQGLSNSQDLYLRAEGLWGIDDYKDANDAFRAAEARQPNNPEIKVRWGRLFHERFNNDDAGKLFQEAIKVNKDYAPAYLGLAIVAEDGYGGDAAKLAEKALQLDPKLVEAQELLAYIALEDNDEPKAQAEADKAIAISPEALDGLAIHAAVDWLNDKPGTEWTDRIFKINPVYGQAYATGAHFFVINRRYEEGIKAYRKALDLNPRLWAARSQLGITLMRLGEDTEARQQLQQCYENDYRNAETVNSLTLLDSYKNFETFKTPTTILRLHKKEADLLRPYFQEQFERALKTYEQKYHYKLNAPVQLEVYPDHEDFSVRTAGMPGLGGILGVTFGEVVAMDSPSGRPPGSFHWAGTMWHELSHVYVLTMTNHRVPRWFTEGLSVYEETAASPDWGDPLDPASIDAIKNHKLLPVAQIDRGFVHPTYPAQVNVSYFQAGKIITYITEKWGFSKVLDMIHSYAALKTTPQTIQENLGITPEEFDKQFLAWLTDKTKVTVDHFDEWKKSMKVVADDMKAKKYDEAIQEGTRIRDFYPDFVQAGSDYEMLADAYAAKNDAKDELAQLERYNQVGGRDPGVVERLATLEVQAGNKQKAAAALERLNLIYPEADGLHRRLGDLLMDLNKPTQAVREYQALLALKPLDQATAHYDLARALRGSNRNNDARDQVLLSLEAAPGYKPAQQLLLELTK